MINKTLPLCATLCGLILTGAPPGAQAQLVSENFNGVALIYDPADNLYWTRNADLTGNTFNFQDAQTWAANLNYAGIGPANWQLPTADQFTALYNQLTATVFVTVGNQPVGIDRFGAQVFFGNGADDYAINVAPEYWTDTDGTDFNFYYGYGGGRDDSSAFPAWAVTTVPEPGVISLAALAAGLAVAKRCWRGKSR